MPVAKPMTVAELRRDLAQWPADTEIWVAVPRSRVVPVLSAGCGGPNSKGDGDFLCLIAAPIARAAQPDEPMREPYSQEDEQGA